MNKMYVNTAFNLGTHITVGAITAAVSLIIGSYVTYLHMTVRQLSRRIEEVYLSVPTAEDMAKEVVRIKLPLAELPPGMAEKLKQGGFIPGIPPQMHDGPPPPSSARKGRDSTLDYVG